MSEKELDRYQDQYDQWANENEIFPPTMEPETWPDNAREALEKISERIDPTFPEAAYRMIGVADEAIGATQEAK